MVEHQLIIINLEYSVGVQYTAAENINEPYPQLRHEIKMASVVWGLCTESLWRCYRFAMNDIKKSKNISGEASVYTIIQC